MFDYEKQGQRIREMRLKNRYTQEYVAQQLHSTKQAIYKYESNTVRRIPEEKLLTMASLFGCSVDYLKGLTDEPGLPPRQEADFPAPVGRAYNVPPAPQKENPLLIYHRLTELLPLLTAEERNTLLAFGEFLLGRHAAPGEGEAEQ